MCPYPLVKANLIFATLLQKAAADALEVAEAEGVAKAGAFRLVANNCLEELNNNSGHFSLDLFEVVGVLTQSVVQVSGER